MVKELGEKMVTKSENMPGVVLSGLPVSGKSTLAKMIAASYGLGHVALGQYWRDAYARLPDSVRATTTFEVFWEKSDREENYRINAEAKPVFESGTVVGESRYVSYLDRNKCLLVFVFADLDIRADRALKNRVDYQESGLDIEAIKKLLRVREEAEYLKGMELFGVDYRDRSRYDLHIDSGIRTPEEEFRMVQEAIGRRIGSLALSTTKE